MPYGYSLGLKKSSPRYTNRLGRERGTSFPLTPLQLLRAGGAAAAIYWSPCSFYKVSSLFGHPLEALSPLPFPKRSCTLNNTKSAILFPTFPLTYTLEVFPRILLMLSREPCCALVKSWGKGTLITYTV